MLSISNLESIESEGRRLVAAARKDPSAPVPQYPGWTLTDLASHTASIHGRTVVICEELPQERISAPGLPEGLDPIDWCEENLDRMVSALRAVDSSATSWAFGPDKVVGFWERRMVIETGVHRWDADQAHGQPDPLTDYVAAAGLDEFGHMWLPTIGEVQTLAVGADDLGREWVFGDGEPTATVSGLASDIYLSLVTRPSGIDLPDDWHAAIRTLGTPPKR